MTDTTVHSHYGPPYPLKDRTFYGLLPLELTREVISFLQAHDIQVGESEEYRAGSSDYHIVTFPEGTIEQRLFPTVESDRCKLTLPDGMSIYTIYNPHVNVQYEVTVHSIGMELAALELFLKENPEQDTRPTFEVVRERHELDAVSLADVACMSKERVEQIERGEPAGEDEMVRIVAALNAITKGKYQLFSFSGLAYQEKELPAK